MSPVDPQRFELLRELLGDAMELPSDRRDAYLVAHCGGDAALLAEARDLLAHDNDTDSARVTDMLKGRVARAATDISAPTHPASIGPFEILEVLGEGGMGVVYGARQHQPLEREVALKVVRSTLAVPSLLARFHAERQTLARLEHPHIARLFDAGSTPDGLPYFVMEWVHGDPITTYCRKYHLDYSARLALFTKVCLAVHHAHQKAIIHRDLKPGNVLVAEVDGVPEPKVIDFGIARVTAADGATEGFATAHGAMLGTLEYMSPEQAGWGDTEVDVRADVYSLGVMLYELLTGTLPYSSESLRNASPLEVQRLLRDTDPPTPSARVRTGSASPASDPPVGWVPATMSREVDWVVMMALEKDPARRYQSAHALAADLTHLLRHEPVVAAPASLRYRASKFVRRHRAGTAAAAVAVTALVGGAAAATAGLIQANRARAEALVEARKAEAVSNFLTGMFAEVEPDRARGNVVTVRDMLDSAAVRLDRDQPFATEPEVEATIRFAIGNSYRELGDYRAALPMLQRALTLWESSLDPDDNRIADALHGIGNSLWRMGSHEAALPYAERVLAIRSRTVGRMHPKYAEAVHVVANSQADLGHYAVAESLYRDAVQIDSAVLVGDERERLGTSLNNLGTVLVDLERFDEAIGVFQQSLAIRRQYLHPDDPQIASVLSNIGHTILLAGRAQEAADTLARAAEFAERVFGPRHVQAANVWMHHAQALLQLGRLDEAEREFRRAREVFLQVQGAGSYRAGQATMRLGEVTVARGHAAAGVEEMRRGWELVAGGLGAQHPTTRAAAERIAVQYEAMGLAAPATEWRARAVPAAQ